MKIYQIVLFFGLILTSPVSSQTLEEALSQTFANFESDTVYQSKLQIANRFQMIAGKWPEEWASHYYTAYAHMQLSYFEPDMKKKDAWCDKAEEHLNKMVEISGEKSDEWFVLAANLASARLSVDPENRWMQYGSVFDESLKKAIQINPDNPRAPFLQGTSLFYTPKQFGGGPENAVKYFEKAALLFAAEPDDNILKPSWGEEANTYFIGECHKQMDK